MQTNFPIKMSWADGLRLTFYAFLIAGALDWFVPGLLFAASSWIATALVAVPLYLLIRMVVVRTWRWTQAVDSPRPSSSYRPFQAGQDRGADFEAWMHHAEDDPRRDRPRVH